MNVNNYLGDPVLNLTATALRLLRWGALIIMAFALVASALTLVATLVPGVKIFDTANERLTFTIIMPVAVAMGYLLARFLKELRDLVLSVRKGQPLSSENASRLRRMGWLWLGLEGVTLLTGLVFGLFRVLNVDWEFDTDAVVDLVESLLIAASLFILARIFDHGARMQEELEGTV